MFTLTTAGRLIGTASAVALLLGPGITAASPAKPSFTSATAALDADFDYMATWTETGLGKKPVTVDYELVSTNASSTFQCFSANFKPRGEEQPGPTEELVAPVPPPEKLTAVDGTIKGMLTLRELNPGNASCGRGEFLCRVFVSFADNTIMDLSNSVSAALPNISTKIPPPTDKAGLAGNCFAF